LVIWNQGFFFNFFFNPNFFLTLKKKIKTNRHVNFLEKHQEKLKVMNGLLM